MTLPRPAVRARLALAVAARDTADRSRGVLGDLGRPNNPGDRIVAARRVRALAMRLVETALLVELAEGASWATIAEALGLSEGEARRRYGDTAALWLAEEAAPGLDLSVFGTNDADDTLHPDEDPAGLAEALDQWFMRHADPWESAGEHAGILG